MDPTRFDALARAMTRTASPNVTRRVILTALGGLLAGSLSGATDLKAGKRRRSRVRNRVRRRHEQRKNNAPCPTGQQLCNGQCAGCCADADCGGNACRDGRCAACPNDQRECRGGCIPMTACCSDGDCTGSRTCIDGACTCRANERLCQGACIPSDACCGSDCPPGPTCSSETCGGCCAGNVCRQGDSQNFCGRGGEACETCGQRAICDAGNCVCPEGLVQCAEGHCIRCNPRETCESGACVCPTECCADAHCTEGKGGLCRPDGTCAYLPGCKRPGTPLDECNNDTLEGCCSLGCNAVDDICTIVSSGRSCYTGDDCASTICSYYVCA
jgi:hypothetical protein